MVRAPHPAKRKQPPGEITATNSIMVGLLQTHLQRPQITLRAVFGALCSSRACMDHGLTSVGRSYPLATLCGCGCGWCGVALLLLCGTNGCLAGVVDVAVLSVGCGCPIAPTRGAPQWRPAHVYQSWGVCACAQRHITRSPHVWGCTSPWAHLGVRLKSAPVAGLSLGAPGRGKHSWPHAHAQPAARCCCHGVAYVRALSSRLLHTASASPLSPLCV
jgi:hypothetical protein